MTDGTQPVPEGVGEKTPTMAEAGVPEGQPRQSGVSIIQERARQAQKAIQEAREAGEDPTFTPAHRDPSTDQLRDNSTGQFKPEPNRIELEDAGDDEIVLEAGDDEEYVTLGGEEEELEDERIDPALDEGEPEYVETEPAAEGEDPRQDLQETVTVELPARHENEDPMEVQLVVPEGEDPQKAIDRYNQYRNEGMRRQQFNDEMERVRRKEAQLEEVLNLFREPDTAAEFVMEQMAPEVQTVLAQRMLAALPDETFAELVNDVAKWSRDPEARETERLRQENERLRRRNARKRETNQDPALTAIRDEVLAMIPESVDDRKAGRFYHVAMQELSHYVQENRLRSLTPSQAVEVIRQSGLPEDFGLGSSTPEARGSAPAAARRKAPPAKETPTGKDLAQRAARRKEAAAVAPAGVGASSAPAVRFKKGQTVEDRIKDVKKAVKKGVLRFGRS